MIRTVPVTPDSGDARDWISRELAKPEYRAAAPNWFDRLVSGFWDWLRGLLGGATGAPPSVAWGLVFLVLIAGLVAAYLVFGPPRLGRRARTTDGALFGDDDSRTASAMRLSAERAAAAGDWTLATEEMFRACARGLAERAVITSTPGTTARGFALRARRYFPGLERELDASAVAFDDVRYLGRAGTEAGFATVSALEQGLRASRPRFENEDTNMAIPG